MNKKELKSRIGKLKKVLEDLLLECDEKDVDKAILVLFSYAYCYDKVDKDLMISVGEVMGYPRDEIFLNLVELEKEKLRNEETKNCAIC